jgi:hypothetical protein
MMMYQTQEASKVKVGATAVFDALLGPERVEENHEYMLTNGVACVRLSVTGWGGHRFIYRAAYERVVVMAEADPDASDAH